MKQVNLLFLLLLTPLLLWGQEIDENILENDTYKARMETFRSHPLRKGQIVFFGNSITFAGKWETYFPKQEPANRGISGDNTDGMLARIQGVIAARPAKIFIMAGVNDISLQRENATILRQVKLLLRQIKAGSPDTEIYVESALPLCDEKLKYSRLKGKEQQIEEYNAGLKALCEEMEITYIDIYTHMLEKPQTLKAEYTTDGLHINKDAYAVWVELIRKYVEQ